MKKQVISALIAATLLSAGAPAQAAPQQRHWSGNIHHFRDHDMPVWTGGHWVHGAHNRRDGWWWVAGNYWYFYSAPVYPYPDPYKPSVVVIQSQVTTEVPAPAPAPADLAPVQDGKSWYYCANPDGYYPYVQGCSVAWKKVPAAPAGSQTAGDTPPPPPEPKYWYHCTNPKGYYPYVAECNGTWDKVTPE